MPWFCQPPCMPDALTETMRVLKFGAKLDLLRRAKGVTLGELSRMSGVPERTTERICAGQSAPCAAHFVRLIKSLGISLEAIDPADLEEEGLA